MPDVTASYGMPCDFVAFLGIFIHYYLAFVSELLWFSQTFTDCVCNQYNINIPNVTASYGMPLNILTNKIDEYSCLRCLILTKH